MTHLGEEDPLPHDSAHGLNSGRQELGPPRPPPPTPMWEGGRAMWGARAPSEAVEKPEVSSATSPRAMSRVWPPWPRGARGVFSEGTGPVLLARPHSGRS